jgi:hypothetical protein
MKAAYVKYAAVLILAALLSWGGGMLLCDHPRESRKGDGDTKQTTAPVAAPQPTSSRPVSMCREGNAACVVSLYSILFASIAEQEQSASRPAAPKSTGPESLRPLPRHDR